MSYGDREGTDPRASPLCAPLTENKMVSVFSVPKFATLGGKRHLTAINFPLLLPISGVNIPLSKQK